MLPCPADTAGGITPARGDSCPSLQSPQAQTGSMPSPKTSKPTSSNSSRNSKNSAAICHPLISLLRNLCSPRCSRALRHRVQRKRATRSRKPSSNSRKTKNRQPLRRATGLLGHPAGLSITIIAIGSRARGPSSSSHHRQQRQRQQHHQQRHQSAYERTRLRAAIRQSSTPSKLTLRSNKTCCNSHRPAKPHPLLSLSPPNAC